MYYMHIFIDNGNFGCYLVNTKDIVCTENKACRTDRKKIKWVNIFEELKSFLNHLLNELGVRKIYFKLFYLTFYFYSIFTRSKCCIREKFRLPVSNRFIRFLRS